MHSAHIDSNASNPQISVWESSLAEYIDSHQSFGLNPQHIVIQNDWDNDSGRSSPNEKR